jgi:hypothetical protein
MKGFPLHLTHTHLQLFVDVANIFRYAATVLHASRATRHTNLLKCVKYGLCLFPFKISDLGLAPGGSLFLRIYLQCQSGTKHLTMLDKATVVLLCMWNECTIGRMCIGTNVLPIVLSAGRVESMCLDVRVL